MTIQSQIDALVGNYQVQVNRIGNDIRKAKKTGFSLLNSLDDQSALATANLNTKSWVLHDEKLPTTSDTVDGSGTVQGDNNVAPIYTVITLDKFKSSSRFFPYAVYSVRDDRINGAKSFVADAPYSLLKELEKYCKLCLLSIGATEANYIQMTGSDTASTPNAHVAVSTNDLLNGIAQLVEVQGLSLGDLTLAVGVRHSALLASSMFDYYTGSSSSAAADEARRSGQIGQALGVPVIVTEQFVQKATLHSKKAVSYMVRMSAMQYEEIAHQKRDFISLDAIWGAIPRVTNECVVYGREAFADKTLTVA